MAPSRVPREHEQRVPLAVAADRVHRHREATLRSSLASSVQHGLDLTELVTVEGVKRVQRRRETRLVQAGHGLTHLADRPSLEREGARIDHRLVTEIHAVQPEACVDVQDLLAGADDGELQTAGAGERAQIREQLRKRRRRADRVAGNDQDAGLDAVADECGPLRVEEVVLVGTKLEERERILSVAANDLDGEPADLRHGQRPRRRERPEDDVRDGEERRGDDHMGRQWNPRKMDVWQQDRVTLEVDRTVLAAHERPRLADHARGGRTAAGGPSDERYQNQADHSEHAAPARRRNAA